MKTILLILLVLACACGKKMTTRSDARIESLTPEQERLSAEDSLIRAVESNDLSTATGFARRGLNLDLIMRPSGHTLLTYSLEENMLPMAEMLLENGARGNRFDDRGIHPLFIAIESGDLNIVKALMMNGAQANVQDSNFSTPLIHAVKYKRNDIAYHLLDAGADITVLDSNGRNAFDYAQELKLDNLALSLYLRSTLAENMDNMDLLMSLLDQGQTRNIADIVTKNPGILNRFQNPGPMTLAARMKSEEKSLEVIKLFAELGEDINGRYKEDVHPLAVAASLGRINTLDYLLGQGADVMRVDSKGETALIHAIRNREAGAVKFLLKKQADKNYHLDLDENNVKVKACDIAREVRAASPSSKEKKRSEDVMWELGCGLRWLFSW